MFTVKKRVIVIKNKARKAKNAISRAAKDRVLALPGISTIINLPEPPFPHLLQSNIPPSDSESIDILEVISDVEAQSLRLQEINELGMDRMTKHQLDLAHHFVHAHKGVLSAIRRFPPELLQEIFIHITVPWTYSRWNTIPWALSQVCRLWRTTALSVSSMWSRLPTIYLHKKIPSSYAAQIRELLLRSRDAPISFYLYAPFKELSSHPIIDALVLHSERWQTVAIDSTTPTIFAFNGIKGRLSSLRSLSLEVWRQTDPVVFDMFEDAPQLREVSLDGPFPGEVRLPFSQLTRYKERVRGRGMADFTISLATSLTTLEISRLSESPDIPVTTLPLLVTLKVQFDDIISQGFLENVTLPAIQEILISGFEGHLITILTAMISRSQSPCMLKKFAFRTSELDSGELTTLLRLTPLLVELNLPLPPPEDLSNLIIGRNNNNNNSRPLVPLLQMLTFEAEAVRRAETSQALNDLAVSRCHHHHQNTTNLTMSDESVELPGDVVVPPPPADHQILKELRILFKSSRTCHYELRFMENWVQSEDSKQLEVWKENLLQEVPELEGRPAPRKRKFDMKWSERVFDIFSNIENYQVGNVNDIYVRKIMHSFFSFFVWFEYSTPSFWTLF